MVISYTLTFTLQICRYLKSQQNMSLVLSITEKKIQIRANRTTQNVLKEVH